MTEERPRELGACISLGSARSRVKWSHYALLMNEARGREEDTNDDDHREVVARKQRRLYLVTAVLGFRNAKPIIKPIITPTRPPA